MNVKERIAGLVQDYYLKNRCYPRRITVSSEVAREMDAELDASNLGLWSPIEKEPKLLRDGTAMWYRGVLIVADLEAEDVLDIR